MNFVGQDKHGYAVIRSLRDNGPQTVREIAESIGSDTHSTDQAVRRMMCRGQVQRTGERKGVGSGRANIYRWVDVEEADLDPLMNETERNRAIESADRIVRSLRAAYNPSMFDPFRVLRAQVGGMA
ncbi:hypothetical protein D3C87_820830 [compost metagenome]